MSSDKVEGITWHAIVLEAEPFAATRTLLTDTMGLSPRIEMDGWSLFGRPNGSIIDLFAPEAAAGMCPWGVNDGVVFGVRVDDIHTASQHLEAAGCEPLGDINVIEQSDYSWRHSGGRTAACTASTSSTDGAQRPRVPPKRSPRRERLATA